MTIPHEDLYLHSIRCMPGSPDLRGLFPVPAGGLQGTNLFSELAVLGDSVPTDVKLGYHLCYGTPYDEHLVMPKDVGILVELMNGIVDGVKRTVDFLHIPVPKGRTDQAYFMPLKNFKNETKLYLGSHTPR